MLVSLAGCTSQTGRQPPQYRPPGQTFGINCPQPNCVFKPHTPIVYAPTPVPIPGTPPVAPNPPGGQPGTTPANPIGLPTPSPTQPSPGYEAEWKPWPLPPNRKLVAFQKVSPTGLRATREPDGLSPDINDSSNGLKSNGYVTTVGYRQAENFGSAAGDRQLKYRGGHIIRDLEYVNLYVSGDTAWSTADIEQVEKSLSAAMRDEHLNNVLRQYFENQPITSTALPPHPLVGYVPQNVTRGDIENYILHLYRLGYLKTYDLDDTVFNLLLPPRTVLSDHAAASHTQSVSGATSAFGARASSDAEPADSVSGLAGYHGSVVPPDGRRIYFTVAVYSQRSTTGRTNGIPVFAESWKSVTATLYHQLIEARTDPDVEDALRGSSDLDADGILGWVSDSGLEIGDVLNDDSIPISTIFREVPLADGNGFVPVQLPYSNFARSVEGPIRQPHPLASP